MTGFQTKRAMSADRFAQPLDKADREELVSYLADSDYDYIMNEDGGLELLDSYLRQGFKGYDNFTDIELITEYKQREEMK
jgi:hypothetical protein